MQSKEFKAAMVLKGYTIKTLSVEMGISINALSNKINGKSEFKPSEIITAEKLLGVRRDIFFEQ